VAAPLSPQNIAFQPHSGMNPTRDQSFPIIDSVLHPTDFSEASLVAFYHALKAALIAKSSLTILHVATADSGELMDFPGVRETLERWGLLPKGSSTSAVPHLGIDVRKIAMTRHEPVASVLHYLEDHPAELIVLATHRHEGRIAWLGHSVAKPIARRSNQMTLFIPEGDAGFVAASDGSVSLKNILIPVAGSPAAQPAVEAAARVVSRLNCPGGAFTLLHVGEGEAMPAVQTPEVPDWEWKRITRTGDVIEAILDTARITDTDLVVMSTDGRNGFLDGLRGSHTERVLEHVPAPLLAVPEGSTAEAYLKMAAR
jgi:nucleotide-binding universal stress UspA family protein